MDIVLIVLAIVLLLLQLLWFHKAFAVSKLYDEYCEKMNEEWLKNGEEEEHTEEG